MNIKLRKNGKPVDCPNGVCIPSFTQGMVNIKVGSNTCIECKHYRRRNDFVVDCGYGE